MDLHINIYQHLWNLLDYNPPTTMLDASLLIIFAGIGGMETRVNNHQRSSISTTTHFLRRDAMITFIIP